MIRWIGIVLLIAVVVVFLVAFVVTRVENAQHSANQQLQERQATASDKQATTAVVVFSRSGNTGILANHIANKTNANIYEITANNYELGVPGLISALKDARSNVADIMPTRIDLSSYDTVYLGSPIWLYSPAPPIWQFAKDNDFTNKHVVLFNTFNSKFEQHFIDEFEALVRSNGAVSFSHQYVKRGRMGSQISTEQMLKIFDQKQ
ncbi:flavodoxin family protein [Vibrio natriegens]|uniref:Flavodoxin-like domain-containing protein n=1 Tax=Vibrio natriegens NBRC 15636 = ATCC 14048 = DSM 759 TaxID=1219067 RepID=A0AAN0Y7F5_VIBNA|nr:flavodoxin [Vibrio natriegens]ALR17913.1 hypothetical protein PN96_18295 [Vibrio natriegens NBRC 15636 = ATCC 14048 = DSM 759]ANQ15406.1 hypothetical protein BA890_22145 [Vibrio natriegens NBRC 15636 = ATCC 14048 = DSM 759]EPM41114.1 hypothetical protein M272_01725 [Vibrio natriegens NBRC 15636 = ATCC 14048 = DSM 759]MDX6029237.1 flavodoxin [Vibrio natriegens NBRC 15636 = ATCC 14048 = DSM 759]UUI14056.1 hypothetical protein NP431_15555 [Vibrio natriegens]